MAEPSGHTGGASGETCLRKLWIFREGQNRKNEKQWRKHQDHRRVGAPGTRADIQLEATEDPTPEQVDITEGTAACGEPMRELGTSMKGKTQH